MADPDGFITRREALDLVRAAIDETIEATRRRTSRWTTGTMVTTSTVRLDDDDGVLSTIGTATAGARVLCHVQPPSVVYVIRTL